MHVYVAHVQTHVHTCTCTYMYRNICIHVTGTCTGTHVLTCYRNMLHTCTGTYMLQEHVQAHVPACREMYMLQEHLYNAWECVLRKAKLFFRPCAWCNSHVVLHNYGHNAKKNNMIKQNFHFLPLQRKSFDLYRVYGENNEHAQKLLHELGEDQAMKAFFIVSWWSVAIKNYVVCTKSL